jgi:hypothetical protein
MRGKDIKAASRNARGGPWKHLKTLFSIILDMRGIRTTRRMSAALAAGIVLGGCGAPIHETIRTPYYHMAQSEAPQAARADAERVTVASTSQAVTAQGTDPFAMDSTLRSVLSDVGTSGGPSDKLSRLFERLHSGAAHGVTVMDMTGRAPRAASEALAQGGDCTDLANIAIALMRELSIPGGAMVVHFDSAPAGIEHMVPYATIEGRRVIVDLQAGTLGQTAQGTYTIVMAMTYEQAASMYHREMGDYQRDQGQSAQAIAEYGRAAEIFNGDAYVQQNLGVLLERNGQMSSATEHYQRAAQLDPSRYGTDLQRGQANTAAQRFNTEIGEGERAFSEQRWADCVSHFRAALDSGAQIPADTRTSLERNIATCQSRLGQ